jgi:hypothetical protein
MWIDMKQCRCGSQRTQKREGMRPLMGLACPSTPKRASRVAVQGQRVKQCHRALINRRFSSVQTQRPRFGPSNPQQAAISVPSARKRALSLHPKLTIVREVEVVISVVRS